MAHSVYIYALLATLCFSTASIVFTEFANRTSVTWVNYFKAFVATVCCALTIQFFLGWQSVTTYAVVLFLVSGLIGLTIGDFFMVSAFQSIGPGRTLLLYGFQPLLVGVASYYAFGQTISPYKLIAILFLIGCLVTFSYERFKQSGSWEFKGFLMALTFIVLDSIGLIMTRIGFDENPNLHPIQAHFIRCLGAVFGFWVQGVFKPFHFVKIFKTLTIKARWGIFFASFFGTFLSLSLYFKAVQTGHLASVTSVSITAPFFATLIESIYHKRWPSKYLIFALIQFVIGFYILIQF
ncbi:MAG: DMT family transporter [Bdellovibrionota bacterium]